MAARLGSSRLPRKALLPLGDTSVLDYLLTRLSARNRKAFVGLLTTTLEDDKDLVPTATNLGLPVFRGHPTDLMQRYLDAAIQWEREWVCRVTADCPFVDSDLLEDFLSRAHQVSPGVDCISTKGQYPIGLDFELFRTSALERALKEPNLTQDHREHLTLYFYEHPKRYKVKRVSPPGHWKPTTIEFTLDTPSDVEKICFIAAWLREHQATITQDLPRLVDALCREQRA